MAKLHEILAIDRDRENVANKVVAEATNTFEKRTEHFRGHYKRLSMYNEDRKQEESGQEELVAITTTVDDKLAYVAEHVQDHFDILADKEFTNVLASGEVIIDGITFLAGLPAALLLDLETRLTRLRKMYEAIPTLQPGIEWVPDETKGPGVFKAKVDTVKHKTEKTIKPIILAPATDKHPAQVDKISIDVPVGDYITTNWSAMVSPAKKSEILGRLDKLSGEVKKARMRANNTDVKGFKIGKKIMDYINKGLV